MLLWLLVSTGCRSGLGACEGYCKLLQSSANTQEEAERALAVVECTQDNDVRMVVWFTDRTTGKTLMLETDEELKTPITVHVEVTNFWKKHKLYEWKPLATVNSMSVLLE